MMDNIALWNLMRETWVALQERFEPAIEAMIEQSGLDGRGWGILLSAFTFEPEPTTASHLMVRVPYTAAEFYLGRLRSAAKLGFFKEVANGEFVLSPKGRSAVQHFIKTARTEMISADPVPWIESKRLSDLLEKLVKRCLETPPPPETWSISLSYKLMPSIDPPLPYFEQAVSCLAAYRDDSHLAAWGQTGLTATSLEVLTLLCRDQAGSFDELIDKLSHRGHEPEVYISALAELRRSNFISGVKNSLKVTTDGQLFRNQIETDTDRYFFTPWDCLDESDRAELENLLTRLRDSLRSNERELKEQFN